MANLRVDKITSTETFETTGSVQFIMGGTDATRDRLTIASNTDFTTSGDFTIEAWIYPFNRVTGGTANSIFGIGDYDSSTGFVFYVKSDGLLSFYTGSDENNTTFKVDSSTWHHVALVRSSQIITIYADGKFIASYGYDNTFSGLAIIGGNSTNGSDSIGGFSGHISNVRYVNGRALYTENFKPPMRELEVVPGTVLLACQSKTDATLEKTGKTITVNNNPSASELTPGLLTPVPKAGGGSAITGSVEFTGNDYLIAPDSSDFEFGTEDFTIECWINASDLKYERHIPIIQKGDSTGNNQYDWRLYFNNEGFGSSILYFDAACSGTAVNTQSTSVFVEQAWMHVAVTRQSGAFKVFFNGILEDTDSSTTNAIDDDYTEIIIGFNDLGGAGDSYLKGYISNLRIVRGTALYTDDFIPPTRELKKVPGTVLLCCQDPDNPLTEATGKTITGYGSLNQSYGTDLVTNGQFTADSDWTKGTQWTISGGSASITDSPDRGSDSLLTQDVSSWIQEGQMYRVAVDWSFSNGDFDIRLGGDSTYTEFSIESSQSSPYFFNIRAGGTNTNLAIIANQHAVGDINSIHVEHIPPSKAGSNFTPQVGDDRKVTFEGVTKVNSDAYFYLPTGNTESRDTQGGHRGLFVAGSSTNTIEFVTISTGSNASSFGDTSGGTTASAACSSSTRGISAGGLASPVQSDVIEYVTISSTGDTIDFGNLTVARRNLGASSNSIRGLFFGGSDPAVSDVIDFITISSTGNALDFGDITTAVTNIYGCASPTRGILGGGESPTVLDTIEYVTIASKGDAQDFGDLTTTRSRFTSTGSGTRGVFTAGRDPSNVNTIDYVTIATTGNAADFGDVTLARQNPAATSDSIRGVIAGGYTSSNTKTIDFIVIPAMGNAQDFGDLIAARREFGACSNGHGGLG